MEPLALMAAASRERPGRCWSPNTPSWPGKPWPIAWTCAAWGLVMREADPRDARARRIVFTATGLDWLAAFRAAVAQAEAEFRAAVGDDVATVVALGLEAYAASA